jgi:hypothetical protein
MFVYSRQQLEQGHDGLSEKGMEMNVSNAHGNALDFCEDELSVILPIAYTESAVIGEVVSSAALCCLVCLGPMYCDSGSCITCMVEKPVTCACEAVFATVCSACV